MRKSSIRLPDFNFAASQRGVFPRPAQVSDGRSGFRNFGTTVGYGRFPVDELARSASPPALSCFKRSSSTRFSASSVAASLEDTSSCSAHNSSVDIDLKLVRFTTVPNHDSIFGSHCSQEIRRKHEQNKTNSEPLSGGKFQVGIITYRNHNGVCLSTHQFSFSQLLIDRTDRAQCSRR